MSTVPSDSYRTKLLFVLCQQFDSEEFRRMVASEIGRVTKGELMDFADLYCQRVSPELTKAEQEVLLTNLWNWREEYITRGLE